MSSLSPFVDRAAWMGSALKNSDEWIWALSDAEIQELNEAVAQTRDRDIAEITKKDFPLPQFGARLERLRDEVRDGLGFGVVRGIPTKSMTDDAVFRTFWGIGAHLGFAISQNSYGDVLGHVYDEKPDPSEISPRGYRTNQALKYHTDRSDIVGLLCLRKALEGGESSITSSMGIFNAILESHPDAMGTLMDGYLHGHAEDVRMDEPFRFPIFHFKNDVMSCRLNRGALERAHVRAGVPLTKEEASALVAFDFYAEHPDYRLDMLLLDGDIQFVNNYRVVHSRNAFRDGEKKEQQRHMVRLWLNYYDDPWPRGPHLFDYNGVRKELNR
ncbi:MAG: TauD/TfdA family dioxygenase [Proteobacteria bacterium]|nr:TauD/TfdA family dioxygenase [Pseudomonadota bacterium]